MTVYFYFFSFFVGHINGPTFTFSLHARGQAGGKQHDLAKDQG